MSKLFIVPTPIGNLEDITLRALRILKEVDLILSEDTRKTGHLLRHYSINAKQQSYHTYNEHQSLQGIIEKLKTGESIALVSDAGTPSISDPGYLIVRECIKNNIEVECLPGATALIPALVNSGFPSNEFCFEGFLPHKKGRQKKLEMLKTEHRTLIFYESPFRIEKLIDELISLFGEQRKASLSREISKIHEKTIRGSLIELKQQISTKKIKGEIVLVVEGFKDDNLII